MGSRGSRGSRGRMERKGSRESWGKIRSLIQKLQNLGFFMWHGDMDATRKSNKHLSLIFFFGFHFFTLDFRKIFK